MAGKVVGGGSGCCEAPSHDTDQMMLYERCCTNDATRSRRNALVRAYQRSPPSVRA